MANLRDTSAPRDQFQTSSVDLTNTFFKHLPQIERLKTFEDALSYSSKIRESRPDIKTPSSKKEILKFDIGSTKYLLLDAETGRLSPEVKMILAQNVYHYIKELSAHMPKVLKYLDEEQAKVAIEKGLNFIYYAETAFTKALQAVDIAAAANKFTETHPDLSNDAMAALARVADYNKRRILTGKQNYLQSFEDNFEKEASKFQDATTTLDVPEKIAVKLDKVADGLLTQLKILHELCEKITDRPTLAKFLVKDIIQRAQLTNIVTQALEPLSEFKKIKTGLSDSLNALFDNKLNSLGSVCSAFFSDPTSSLSSWHANRVRILAESHIHNADFKAIKWLLMTCPEKGPEAALALTSYMEEISKRGQDLYEILSGQRK
jgi:hypothetical protein